MTEVVNNKKPEIAIKVCGMKHQIDDVAGLAPDYLGFIFYEKSPRNYTDAPFVIPKNIKKVGVFVNAPLAYVLQVKQEYSLDVLQLHGEESAAYIVELRNKIDKNTHIWKVFSVKDTFNFDGLHAYETLVHAFLFDTKGKSKGGNGYAFDWNILKKYPSKIPFVLSGGIGLTEISAIKSILVTNLPLLAVDVNSKFEIEPGRKNISQLKTFINQLQGFKLNQ